jgi:Arc/MetJ family transcription regulator
MRNGKALARRCSSPSALYVAYPASIHYIWPMTATQIDLDDDALAAAMRELGTTTKKDTVNAALREVANRSRRMAAFRRLAARSTNEQDAADYFARREAAKGAR